MVCESCKVLKEAIENLIYILLVLGEAEIKENIDEKEKQNQLIIKKSRF
jgi:hypothetical protein